MVLRFEIGFGDRHRLQLYEKCKIYAIRMFPILEQKNLLVDFRIKILGFCVEREENGNFRGNFIDQNKFHRLNPFFLRCYQIKRLFRRKSHVQIQIRLIGHE